MLKIKDSVDLKELEKFGFKYRNENKGDFISCQRKDKNENIWIDIVYYKVCGEDKNIFQHTDDYAYNTIPTEEKYIQDLIQADLVDKVDETND